MPNFTGVRGMSPAKVENARVPACCLEQQTIFSANKSAVTGRGLFLFFAAQDNREENFLEMGSNTRSLQEAFYITYYNDTRSYLKKRILVSR